MVWLYVFFILLLFLFVQLKIEGRLRTIDGRLSFSVKVLLFWDLLSLEYRGGVGFNEEILVGPLSLSRPILKRGRASVFTRVSPYGSLLLHTLPLLHHRHLNLSLYLAFNLGDPVLTGMGVGLLYMMKGLLIPYLQGFAQQRTPLMKVMPSFNGDTSLDIQGIIITTIGYSMVIVLYLILQLRKWRRDHASY